MTDHQKIIPDQAEAYPMIPLRDLVIFPFMRGFDLYLGRPFSLAALKVATSKDGLILLAAQRDSTVENPTAEQVISVGTLARVTECQTLTPDVVRVWLDAVERAQIKQVEYTDDGWRAIVQLAAPAEDNRYAKQSAQRLKRKIGKLIELINGLPASTNILVERFLDCVSVGPAHLPDFADRLADYLYDGIEERQRYLEMFSAQERLAHLNK